MSNLDRYLAHVEGVTGYRRQLSRVHALTGHQSTLLGSTALAEQATVAPAGIDWGIGTAAGLVAGGIIGMKYEHWLLGAISGASVFTNVPALLRPTTRSEAFWNLVQTNGAVLAAYAASKSNEDSAKRRAIVFTLTYLGIGVARYLYSGENK